jgi:hypothetical protein
LLTRRTTLAQRNVCWRKGSIDDRTCRTSSQLLPNGIEARRKPSGTADLEPGLQVLPRRRDLRLAAPAALWRQLANVYSGYD